MKTYVQLIYEQRCQIYALIKTDLTQQKIADAVGVSQSAISRELKRNRGKRGNKHSVRLMPAVQMQPRLLK